MVTTRSGKRKSMDAFPIVEPQELPSSASKRQKLPLRKKTARSSSDADIALDLDAALQEDVATQTPPTPVAKKQSVIEVAPAPAAEDDGEEEDSDDEAPEAVSNVQAASRAREAAEAMMKTAKEETDKLRTKRKERDARLKEQAQSRKAKKDTQTEPQPEAQDLASAEAALPSSPAGPTPRFGRVEIPTLLPAEFLDSDSEAEDEDGDEQAPKRRKAEAQKSRAPRDKRVGGAVYRVMTQADARMAPKGEGRSQRVRTGLVKRGREEARKAGGFLVGGTRRVDWGTSRR